MIMMLEEGEVKKTEATDEDRPITILKHDDNILKIVIKILAERDPLRNATRPRPVEIRNRFKVLHDNDNDDDDGDEIEDIDEYDDAARCEHSEGEQNNEIAIGGYYIRHRPN